MLDEVFVGKCMSENSVDQIFQVDLLVESDRSESSMNLKRNRDLLLLDSQVRHLLAQFDMEPPVQESTEVHAGFGSSLAFICNAMS
jgi:hypothetical protein